MLSLGRTCYGYGAGLGTNVWTAGGVTGNGSFFVTLNTNREKYIYTSPTSP